MGDHLKFMRLAIEQAKLSLNAGILPVGSIVTTSTGVVGIGRKKGERPERFDHAEIYALRGAMEHNATEVSSMTIYTTLEPCIMCFGAILNCRIPRIIYAMEDPYGGATSLPQLVMPERHSRFYPTVAGGILRDDASKLFREFFDSTTDEFWRDARNPLVKASRRTTQPDRHPSD